MCLSLLLASTFFITVAVGANEDSVSSQLNGISAQCNRTVYCDGRKFGLLWMVQELHVFNDSKHFVDLAMKEPPNVVMDAFYHLRNTSWEGHVSKKDIQQFVKKYFQTDPAADIERAELDENATAAEFLGNISDQHLKDWAEELIQLWKLLLRKTSRSVVSKPEQHSALALPNVFVVPGGRFRELYYWDSYWSLLGLLASGMPKTARLFVENFIILVKGFGFVPNGGRAYYTQRSQPPMLVSMVDALVPSLHSSGQLDQTLEEWLPMLEAEHSFWLENRTVSVSIREKTYRVGRYCVDTSEPRPESFREDIALSEGLGQEEAGQLFRDLASAAESGWDFSSRWFSKNGSHTKTLRDISTCQVIPVDLNSILCHNERTLGKLYKLAGKKEKASLYEHLADQRQLAIDDIFWNETSGLWLDWHLDINAQNGDYFASTFLPLWSRCTAADRNASWQERFLQELTKRGVLSFPGGLPTSLDSSGQQWDMPNGWPPLQWFAVKALVSSQSPAVQEAGQDLLQRWVTTSWLAWNDAHHMFEKYDITRKGAPGGGGEYTIQVGFGWTNGIILDFFAIYGKNLTVRMPEKDGSTSTTLIITIVFSSSIGVVLIFVLLWSVLKKRCPRGRQSNEITSPLLSTSCGDYRQIRSKED